MKKEKSKRSHRRSYLNNFTQNEDGSYTYKGICYRRNRSYGPAAAWAAAAFAVSVISGILPYAPMMNTFYVILCYLGEIASAGFLLWGVLRVIYHGDVLREYIYAKTAARVSPLSITTAVFALAGAVANLIYLILHSFDADIMLTALFFLCKILTAFTVLMSRRRAMEVQWEKIAPGKKTVLDD